MKESKQLATWNSQKKKLFLELKCSCENWARNKISHHTESLIRSRSASTLKVKVYLREPPQQHYRLPSVFSSPLKYQHQTLEDWFFLRGFVHARNLGGLNTSEPESFKFKKIKHDLQEKKIRISVYLQKHCYSQMNLRWSSAIQGKNASYLFKNECYFFSFCHCSKCFHLK